MEEVVAPGIVGAEVVVGPVADSLVVDLPAHERRSGCLA